MPSTRLKAELKFDCRTNDTAVLYKHSTLSVRLVLNSPYGRKVVTSLKPLQGLGGVETILPGGERGGGVRKMGAE